MEIDDVGWHQATSYDYFVVFAALYQKFVDFFIFPEDFVERNVDWWSIQEMDNEKFLLKLRLF